MQFTGTASFAAQRDRVWAFLIDPTHFGPCAPVPITRVGDGRYLAQARVGSGFFATTLAVDVEVLDIVAGQSARMAGKGGASGIGVDASVTFDLQGGPAEGPTVVGWLVDLTLSGAFAGAASGLIAERAPAGIADLVACLRRQVEA